MKHENLLTALAGISLALCVTFITLFITRGETLDQPELRAHLLRTGHYEKSSGTEMSFHITAYCPDSCCNTEIIVENGKRREIDWSDRVSSGSFSIRRLIDRGIMVVAVDPAVIPYGSLVEYNGTLYIALDTGSAIRGNRLDILFPTHEETVRFGVKRGETVTVIRASDSFEVLKEIGRLAE